MNKSFPFICPSKGRPLTILNPSCLNYPCIQHSVLHIPFISATFISKKFILKLFYPIILIQYTSYFGSGVRNEFVCLFILSRSWNQIKKGKKFRVKTRFLKLICIEIHHHPALDPTRLHSQWHMTWAAHDDFSFFLSPCCIWESSSRTFNHVPMSLTNCATLEDTHDDYLSQWFVA